MDEFSSPIPGASSRSAPDEGDRLSPTILDILSVGSQTDGVTAVVIAALLFWLGVFAVFFASQGSSLLEVLSGRLEPLPDDLGQWKPVQAEKDSLARQTHDAELIREERYILPGSREDSSYLIHQVHFRDPETRLIVRVDPERLVRRRRVSARG